MSFLSELSERMRALFGKGRADQELDDELRDHIEREVEHRVRSGHERAAARREALAAFGGVERIKDDVREARGVQPLENAAADLRFAFRALGHNPGFTAAAVLVLGLGIGAATAAFTVYDAVLLRPLPFPDPERLVRIYEQNTATNRWNISTVDFQAIRDQQRSFEAFGAQSAQPMALSGSGAPEQIIARRVTTGWFKAYGVTPRYGRLIEEADESPGAPPAVVVSFPIAESRLGGAAGAPGKAIMLDGVSYQVVGVLAPGMEEQVGLRAAVWPALRMPTPTRRGPFWMQGIARLREGVTLEDAARDLAAISAGLVGQHSDWRDAEAKLTPYLLSDILAGQVSGRLGLFAGAVVLVLLVAIANVATLVLVRASAREQELSVRVALGATRQRIARLILSESLVLVIVAGAFGLLVAALSMRLVGVLSPALPRLAEVGVGVRAVLFAAGATLLSGVLVSVSPVWGVLAGRGSGSLRADARSGPRRSANLVRGALVVAEFALALPLLLGAGLLLNSFIRLQRLDRGYEPRGAVSVSLSLPAARYPADSNVVAFWDRLQVRLAELPGLTSAGLSTVVPPDQSGNQNNFNLVDKPVPEGESEHLALWSSATPGFFEALKVPLLEGRHFTPADTLPVVVVSRAWAERYYPEERAVGKQLVSGGCYDCPRTTIVGVVGDVKYAGTELAPEDVYSPLWQAADRAVHVIARGEVGDQALLRRVSEAIAAMDPELPRAEATLEARTEASLADPARWTAVIGSFGTVAALLAALGVFGLMSFVVRQRRREIGVRLALGAEPAALTRLIVWRGMRYAALGIIIGLGLALLEARWLGALLFEVPATDPFTIVAVALLLAATALVACWIPGLRAARIRPVEVLSSE